MPGPDENTDVIGPLLVDARQAGRLLGVSSGSIRNLISRGVLRPVRIGRRLLIATSELERFIKARMGEEGVDGSR